MIERDLANVRMFASTRVRPLRRACAREASPNVWLSTIDQDLANV
jgi:hypothetical protein